MPAKRLVRRVLVNYRRFFDVLLGDALYNEAGFINLCLDRHKQFINPQLRAKLNLTLIGLAAKLYQRLTDPQLNAPWLDHGSGIPPP